MLRLMTVDRDSRCQKTAHSVFVAWLTNDPSVVLTIVVVMEEANLKLLRSTNDSISIV